MVVFQHLIIPMAQISDCLCLIYSSEEVDSESDGDLNTIKSDPESVIINLSDTDKHIPSIPYVVYSEEQNPWDFIETGLNTDHI